MPLLEKKAEAKWGGQEDYEAYKQTDAGSGAFPRAQEGVTFGYD